MECDASSVGALTLYRPGSRPFRRTMPASWWPSPGRPPSLSTTRGARATKQSALTDQITGLANARCFFLRLEQELSRAAARRARFP